MSPTTRITPMRLSDADRERVMKIALGLGVSMTEATRMALRAMSHFSVAVGLHEPMACALGCGHTAHVWELLPSKGAKGGLRFCAGQPFSGGYDPVDEPSVQAHLKAYSWGSRGLQSCCGATNASCGRTDTSFTSGGCDECGHPAGCH
jgi:hypothetical protein